MFTIPIWLDKKQIYNSHPSIELFLQIYPIQTFNELEPFMFEEFLKQYPQDFWHVIRIFGFLGVNFINSYRHYSFEQKEVIFFDFSCDPETELVFSSLTQAKIGGLLMEYGLKKANDFSSVDFQKIEKIFNRIAVSKEARQQFFRELEEHGFSTETHRDIYSYVLSKQKPVRKCDLTRKFHPEEVKKASLLLVEYPKSVFSPLSHYTYNEVYMEEIKKRIKQKVEFHNEPISIFFLSHVLQKKSKVENLELLYQLIKVQCHQEFSFPNFPFICKKTIKGEITKRTIMEYYFKQAKKPLFLTEIKRHFSSLGWKEETAERVVKEIPSIHSVIKNCCYVHINHLFLTKEEHVLFHQLTGFLPENIVISKWAKEFITQKDLPKLTPKCYWTEELVLSLLRQEKRYA